MPFEPPHALHSRLLFLAEADIDHFLEDKWSWEVFLEQLPTGSLRMEMSYNMIHTPISTYKYILKCLHLPVLVLYGYSLDLRLTGQAKHGSLLSHLHLEKLNKESLLALYLVVVVLYSPRFQEFCRQIQSIQIVDAGFQVPPQYQKFQLDLLDSLRKQNIMKYTHSNTWFL